MKQYQIRFRAEYFCQGWEWGWFNKMVNANSYEEAVNMIRGMAQDKNSEFINPQYFSNETVE